MIKNGHYGLQVISGAHFIGLRVWKFLLKSDFTCIHSFICLFIYLFIYFSNFSCQNFNTSLFFQPIGGVCTANLYCFSALWVICSIIAWACVTFHTLRPIIFHRLKAKVPDLSFFSGMGHNCNLCCQCLWSIHVLANKVS